MENSSRILFKYGNGGLPKIEIHTESSEAELYLHGAHVTKFNPKGDAPLLFLSAESKFENDAPIRGGVPIIFPWFGPREGHPMHGFARTQSWELKDILTDERGAVTLRLRLPESAETKASKLLVEYSVTVSKSLRLQLNVTNDSNEDFTFENCLHTYFSVGDINAVKVVGLEGGEFLDKMENFSRKTETTQQIAISGETDRVYLSTARSVEILDSSLNRKIIVEKTGSNSTVLWNPWIAKSKAMADFGNSEYLQMICVESGNIAENKLVLPPGKTASLEVSLRSVPL